MLDTGKEIEHGTRKLYVLGFVLSILLTLAAYFTVSRLAVVALSSLQALIQLLFFLHLGKEASPRWNLIVFLFTLLIGAIVVTGSLWIMYNLDYRMMG